MKKINLLSFALVACALVASPAGASSKKMASNNKQINASQDIDTLGGNKDLMEMAQKIRSTSKSRIVQERIVVPIIPLNLDCLTDPLSAVMLI